MRDIDLSGYNDTFRAALELLGRDVTIRNQTVETDASGDPVRDEYGNLVWGDPTDTPARIEVLYDGMAEFRQRAGDIDVDIDVIGWVRDDLDVTVTSGEGDETQRATRIIVDRGTYVVRNTAAEQNGLTRFHGEAE